MKTIGFLLSILSIFVLTSVASAADAGFTQADRDRITRLEVKVEEGMQSLQKQIDNLQTILLWGFGILFGGMGLMIGFVIWDRRTALAPVMRRVEGLDEAIRRAAKKDHNLAEALKHAGLL